MQEGKNKEAKEAESRGRVYILCRTRSLLPTVFVSFCLLY